MFVIYQREKVQYFNNRNVITLMRAKKGQKVHWAQIIFNSLFSELDQWSEYVKENKGIKKITYQYALVLAKIFQYLFVHQREIPQKLPTKVKRTREERQKTLENRKKAATNSPRRVLMKKNIIEEGGALGLKMKKEQENTYMRAQKMMRGRVKPFVMPIVVQVARHTTEIPQMTTPQEAQLREQRQDVPHMTSPHERQLAPHD